MANRVSRLTSIIAESTTKINAYLAQHDIPNLSFDADVPPSVQRDKDFTAPRDAALEACNELQALLKGSIGAVLNRSVRAITLKRDYYVRRELIKVIGA
jgi:hypothetical protein